MELRKWPIVLGVLCVSLCLSVLPPAAAQTPSSAAGFTLQALTAEDLDAVQKETGYRVGVLVSQVAPGSAAAAAGIKAGDVLFTVASSGVDSPDAVDKALTGQTGTVEILGVRQNAGGQYDVLQVKMTLSGAAAATPAAPVQPAVTAPAPAPTADVQQKLKALDAAYAAGLLTRQQYDAKKAELEAQIRPAAPAMDEAARQKLQALEAAYAVGILTRQEYDAKKAEIMGQLQPAAPVIDEATRQKLAALDAAWQAGILDQAQFDQKKAELLGQAATVPVQPAGNLSLYRDPQGRFQFSFPTTWAIKPQEKPNVLDIVRGNAAGSIVLVQGEGTADELMGFFSTSIKEQTKDYKELKRGEVLIGPAKGPMIEFTGTNPNGIQAQTMISGYACQGWGYFFMLTVPAAEYPAAQRDWLVILKSFGMQSQTQPAPVPAPTPAPVPAPAPAPAPAGGGEQMGGLIGAPVENSSILGAYFDMLDFMRTQAWGRSIVTPVAERERMSAFLQSSGDQTQQNVAAALQGLPQQWAQLQQKWQAATPDVRTQQIAHWRTQLLLPSFLYAPPPATETFHGRNERVVFEYPRGWTVAQTEDDDNQYLYVGPAGAETSWDTVLDPAASPPGALFVVTQLPDELKGAKSYVDGSRMVASQFVAPPGSGLDEIGVADLEEAAIVTLRGTYPGRSDERFYWVGVVPYGGQYTLAGRLGGPTSMAESLIPAFSHIIASMQLNPPEGDGYHGAMVDYYTARLGNTVAAAGWD